MQRKQTFQDCEMSRNVTYKYLVPLNMWMQVFWDMMLVFGLLG